MFVTSPYFYMSNMSNNNNILSTVEANLPPGFRFHPRDEELICDYLMKKIAGFATPFPLMIVVDLNKCEPWDIPETACVGGKDWYFYSQRDRKYATGLRTNRATVLGYWKATGKDREVLSKGRVVGMRKTLVFYKGRAPKGDKTNWVMHEFRLHHHNSMIHSLKEEEEDWVVCRVFHKNKLEEANKRVCFDDVSSSSSSGLLMDQRQHDDEGSSYLHFQAQAELLQVPCFSNSNAAAAAATLTGAAAKNGDGGEPMIYDNNYYYTNNNMSVIPHDDDELMNSFFNYDHDNVMRAALSQPTNSDNKYHNYYYNPSIWDYSSQLN